MAENEERKGIRKVLLLVLWAIGGAVFALAGVLAWLLARSDSGLEGFALVAAGAMAVLVGLWVMSTLLDSHFEDLERLRTHLLVAAVGEQTRLPAVPAESTPGAEVARLRAAVDTLLGRRLAPGLRPSAKLAAVISTLDEGIAVITETGLVSLINDAARAQLGGARADVGTSVFACLERNAYHGAVQRARAEERPVEVDLLKVDGGTITAVLADMPGGHGGAILHLPPLAEAMPATRPDSQHTARPSTTALTHDMRLHDIPHAPDATENTRLDRLAGLVYDSETTGLDVTRDRLLSVGAVAMAGGHVLPDLNIDLLVNPGRPVPAASTAIHGINDGMVADAPPFSQVWPELEPLLGGRVVIGYGIGFDLAVLRAEARLAALPWRTPRHLDVMRLVAGLYPDWTDLNLETIARYLDVDMHGRHTALGDALMTAEIWARLIPLLEEAGVVTLGEAIRFQNRPGAVLARQKGHGWVTDQEQA